MKFGNLLSDWMFADWQFYYMDYNRLKGMLKEILANKGDLDQYEESMFVDALDKELEKVRNFKDLKGGELERRVMHYEDAFSGLDFSVMEPASIDRMRQELERITEELGQLGKFTRMNYTGFLKILKKHDKHTHYLLKPTYMVKLTRMPLQVPNLDDMVLRLSKLYSILSRAENEPDRGKPKENEPAQVFVRKTTKYWVHPDNVTDVKIAILRNLPVLIYQPRGTSTSDYYHGGGDNVDKRKALSSYALSGSSSTVAGGPGSGGMEFDQAISSVYLDNEAMELYTGRLEKTEGAQAIRIRWYGSAPPYEVFIERKVHREDWTGEFSVKSRFQLKEKYVADFLAGDREHVRKILQKLEASGQLQFEEIEELQKLADEIQAVILEKKLKPWIRTFYHRTAFQLPGDASVRISLDTELAMIKEGHVALEDSKVHREEGSVPGSVQNVSQASFPDGYWKRPDVLCEYPFPRLPPSEIVRFPYAILEVKLQTQAGAQPPAWINTLLEGPLVEMVPKFSKYVHGCAVLFEKQVSLFPFWLPQMNVDIRKPLPEKPVAANASTKSLLNTNDVLKDKLSRSMPLLLPPPRIGSPSFDSGPSVASKQQQQLQKLQQQIKIQDGTSIPPRSVSTSAISTNFLVGERPIQHVIDVWQAENSKRQKGLFSYIPESSISSMKYLPSHSTTQPVEKLSGNNAQLSYESISAPSPTCSKSQLLELEREPFLFQSSGPISALKNADHGLISNLDRKSNKHELLTGERIPTAGDGTSSPTSLTENGSLPSSHRPLGIFNKLRRLLASKYRRFRSRRHPSTPFLFGTNLQSPSSGNSSSLPRKKIAIPVRVEPKVFFANERTFLSWLHFSIILGGIATALVNLGDQQAQFSGYLFAFVSILFSCYALYLYYWRARRIRARDPGPYDDLVGPSLLVIVFLAALSVNFIYSLNSNKYAP